MAMSDINLQSEISSLKTFDQDTIDSIIAEVLRAKILWIEEYGEYQSGGWSTAAIYNLSGNPNEVVIRDGTGIATSTLITQMPFTKKFIEGLNLNIMYARIARLSANSFLWEHVDYSELNDSKRYRLHIPLTTNRSALFVTGGQALTLDKGGMWLLEPITPHGVCNLYGPERLHLIIDCYENEILSQLMNNRPPQVTVPKQLPLIDDLVLKTSLSHSKKLIELGFMKAAEYNLLKLFFRYTMLPGKSYDLINKMYEDIEEYDKSALWASKKKKMLNC